MSVARSRGDTEIQARVKRVTTEAGRNRELMLRDLPLKRHERVFHERVPLPPGRAAPHRALRRVALCAARHAGRGLGYRASRDRGQLLSREELAEAWFTGEYEPVCRTLDEAGLGGPGTETERYLRVAMLRFLLLQTHEWTEEIMERLQGEMRSPVAAEDTMVHQILKEME